MRVAFICSGEPKNLKYLSQNRKEIKKTLSPYWDSVIDVPLANKEALLIDLKDLMIDNEIDDFLFFFTGHGTTDNTSDKLELQLFNTATIDINDIINSVYKIINPKRLAIVVDACYSGTYQKIDFIQNIQFFSSSQYFQESYEFTKKDEEKYGKKIENSVFSHFFCETINELNGEITLHTVSPKLKSKLEEHFQLETYKQQDALLITYGDSLVVADKTLKEHLQKLSSPYQFIIDYFVENNISKEILLESVKKFLDTKLYSIVADYQDITQMITHLSEDETTFPCIVKDIFGDDNNDQIRAWLQSNVRECKEQKVVDEPRVIIVFSSKHDGDKYDVTFSSVNVPHMSNSNASYDLADATEKQALIEEMMNYVALGNPKVDLVLPVELMCEDMNLWEVEFCESLSRFSQLNIRDITRYKSSENETIKSLHKTQWGKVLKKIENHQSLCCISTVEDIRTIGNDMKECGLAFQITPEDKHLKFLLQTNMSYIMFWVTKHKSEDLKPYYKNINALKSEYYALQDKPINLMWDDPTTYYYPKGD